MPITTVIIISLLFLNLCLTLIMFWIIHDLLDATKSLRDSEDLLKKSFDINNQLIEKYSKCLNGVYDREKDLHNELIRIYGAYEKMYDQYKLITDIHTKLLECWKGCEERYSQSYEEFKHCSDTLKEISYQITNLANISTEDEYTLTLNEACDTVCLDCQYKKCQTKVCPVYEIKHHEWTDEDYLEAINTHPETDNK